MVEWSDPDLRPVTMRDDDGELMHSWINLRTGRVWIVGADRKTLIQRDPGAMDPEERAALQFLVETLKRMELGEFGPGLEAFL